MQNEAPFLITPILFSTILAVIGFVVLLRERAQDRKRKEEEARRKQTRPA